MRFSFDNLSMSMFIVYITDHVIERVVSIARFY